MTRVVTGCQWVTWVGGLRLRLATAHDSRQYVASSVQDEERKPHHAGPEPPVVRPGAEEQGGGAHGHPLRCAEDHGGLPALQPGPAQRGSPPQGLPHQVRRHADRGGGEAQDEVSPGRLAAHQAAAGAGIGTGAAATPGGTAARVGPSRRARRQLLPVHQRGVRDGRRRLRPGTRLRAARPHRPHRGGRPDRLLRGGAGQVQRGVLRVDPPRRHVGRRHRGVHPGQALPLRDLRGGHADAARGPLRRGRRLPAARAAPLRRHPLRPTAARDTGRRHERAPAADGVPRHGRRDPGAGAGTGGGGTPPPAVHGRQRLRAALHGVPDGPGGPAGGPRARQGDGPRQLRGGVRHERRRSLFLSLLSLSSLLPLSLLNHTPFTPRHNHTPTLVVWSRPGINCLSVCSSYPLPHLVQWRQRVRERERERDRYSVGFSDNHVSINTILMVLKARPPLQTHPTPTELSMVCNEPCV